MTITLSKMIEKIAPSPTLSLNAKAAELKSAGIPIISLSVGEPDFDTPEVVKNFAIRAIWEGKTKYTPVDGILALKSAISSKFQMDNHLAYTTEQIIVSTGGKQAIFNLMLTLLNEGDEVIIPAPYWVSYPEMVKVAGGVSKVIETTIDQSYKITPEQLEKAITSKTKLLILNSPSNPTGITYTKEELLALSEILLKHPQVFILSDDIYEHILFHQNFYNIPMVCKALHDRTVILNGVSKAYAMTGWRIGYAAGPAKIIKGMKKLQSQSTSNPCSIAQYAALAALNSDQSSIRTMLSAFKRRHDTLFERIKTWPDVKILPSSGTFYSFPDFSALIEKSGQFNDDLDLSEYLLEKAQVAIVPGTAFGMPGALRFSFAVSDEDLEKALSSIEKALGI